MKKTKKGFKILALLLIAIVCCAVMAACNNDDKEGEGEGSKVKEEGNLTVGVLQFGSHPSLDNCNEGIEAALKTSGLNYTIDHQDGNFDSATCDTIAKNMVSKNYDMIFAIATPAATAAYGAARDTEIPVIFCAVSDPVTAGLVDDVNTPGGNCTGVSDLLDLEAQLTIITSFQPEAKNLGVLYTTSEANSLSQLDKLTELAPSFNLTVVSQGVQAASDIPQAATTLASQVDCITNFTDNNVVSNLNVLLEKANDANIPVYGSEIEQVINGCLAAASIDYVALGTETAGLGIRVLGGEDPGSIPVSFIRESNPVINTDMVAQFGFTIPEIFQNAEKVTTNQDQDANAEQEGAEEQE